MRDDEVREAERDKDESPEARARWIRALIDAGRIEGAHVEVLAYAGDAGARRLTELKEPNPLAWVIGLWDYGQQPAVAAVIAMVSDALEQKSEKITGELANVLREALAKATQDELSLATISELIAAVGNVAAFQFATLRMHEIDSRRMVEKGKAAVAAWALSGGSMEPTFALLSDAHEAAPDSATAHTQDIMRNPAVTFVLVARRAIEAMDANTAPETFAEDIHSSMPWVAHWIGSLQPDLFMAMLRQAATTGTAPEELRRFASGLVSRLESHPNWLAMAIAEAGRLSPTPSDT